MITIQWPKWSKIINKSFISLINNEDRYLILYGGRGSGKSDFASKKLIFRCLNENYFRCILIRKTYSTIKDSSYDQIKLTIIELGLEQFFDFKIAPLEITCIENGNKFIARGCDDTQKLKSLKDYSAVWYEEDIIDEDDFIRITTSIRTDKAKYLQEIFTINPEVEGNYQDNWFYKRFFYNNMNEKSFSVVKDVEVGNGKTFKLTYTTHHSTYRNNRWINDGFIAWVKDLKVDNPYYYTIYAEGEWGNRQLGGLAHRNFNRGIHTSDLKYNNELPLHISWDFNTKPYVSLSIFQVIDKDIRCIDAIAGKYPDNTTKKVCQEFIRRYRTHNSGLFIYGDPSGKNEDTRSEEGHNDYKIIEKELEHFRPDNRVASKHPSVKNRLDFINAIWLGNFNGLSIQIDNKCIELINDLLNQKESSDGGKLKEKVSKNGETYEKWGHFNDNFEYFICGAFQDDYKEYLEGPYIDIKEFGENQENTKWGY
jgi:PBSX family phage terminase large subunit